MKEKKDFSGEQANNDDFMQAADEIFDKVFGTGDDWPKLLREILKKYPNLSEVQKQKLKTFAKRVAYTGLKM